MRFRTTATLTAVAAGLAVTACAVRLGGPKPLTYRTLAIAAEEGEAAAAIAQRIRAADADYVLLAAPADSAWFAEVAGLARLTLSGPGNAGTVSLAFLGSEPLGDTTIALPVPGNRPLIVHDALYKLDNYRYLDLMAVRIEPGTEVRPAVRALTSYIAPDVEAGAGIAALPQPLFSDARGCLPGPANGDRARARVRVHLFHGPEARIGCEGASIVESGVPALIARLIVNR